MAWFPITDPAREDDIRMRRRRALLLVACIVFVPWMLFGRTHDRIRIAAPDLGGIHIHIPSLTIPTAPLPRPDAGVPKGTIRADTLRIDLPCAASVTVLSDGTRPGEATISVRHGERAALDALRLADGSISQRTACAGEPGNFIVRVAPVTPLTLVQSGDVDIHGGSFTAPVTIESSGSGDVALQSTGPLTIRQTASGTVSVHTVSGPVSAVLQGSGDLDVAYGSIDALTAESDGSGDLLFGHAILGSGAIAVTLHGSGSFSADAITGPLDASSTSSGDIRIGSLTAAHARLDGLGSGDILVSRGRIDSLSADRQGSGDLAIHAAIDGGRIIHHGSGDLTLPDDSKATVQDSP